MPHSPWGGDENEFLDDANVTALAEERGYVLVAPRGRGPVRLMANRNSWSFRGSTTGRPRARDITIGRLFPDYWDLESTLILAGEGLEPSKGFLTLTPRVKG